MSLRPRSIGTKLFWAIGVPGFLAAVFGVFLFWRQAVTAVGDASRDEAKAIAEVIAKNPSPELIHSRLLLLQRVRTLRVVDPSGMVRWSRDPGEEGRRLPEAPAADAEHLQVEGDRVELTRPLRGLGTLQLEVAQPELRERVGTVFGRALSSVGVLFALLLGLTGLSLHLFLTRPLRRLALVMHRAEEGDFLVRAGADREDELGKLADAFNRMLQRLTTLKAAEIDTHRDLAQAQEQLSLKQALEETNRALSQRVNEQSLLFDVARSLTSTLELPEIFTRISSLVGERLKIPQFSIMLLLDERLVVKSAWPEGQNTEGVSFEVGEGACGRAARTQTAVYIPDLAKDAQLYQRRPGEQEVRGALLSVPMKHKDTVLGVINFERPEANAFSSEEIELLGAVTDLAAIATKNALLHQETVALSITDPLTGAANRRHLFARLELEVARAGRYESPLSVLMVDIDHFKQLNDTSGHRAGDQVLRRVCDLLRGATRKVDTLARYGGEEFMLILPQVSRPEAMEVAEKLRRAVAEAPFEEGPMQPLGKVTISIGVASLHQDATTLETLVDCADSALYASKRAGRNKATGYEPGMELHPGRERGPYAAKRRRTGEQPLAG